MEDKMPTYNDVESKLVKMIRVLRDECVRLNDAIANPENDDRRLTNSLLLTNYTQMIKGLEKAIDFGSDDDGARMEFPKPGDKFRYDMVEDAVKRIETQALKNAVHAVKPVKDSTQNVEVPKPPI
jgi:hypothetical protein